MAVCINRYSGTVAYKTEVPKIKDTTLKLLLKDSDIGVMLICSHMIYQCYFRPEHKTRLFTHRIYRGFGLEPEVNPRICRRCPELKDPRIRLFLCEYGAMLHLWRNPPWDWHGWIGFTSYRQIEKTEFIFSDQSEIRKGLEQADILGWGFHNLEESRINELRGAAAQLEICHPGGFAYLRDRLQKFNIEIPPRFFSDTSVLFANYWVMKKKLFRNFMEFSWPILEDCFRDAANSAYAQSHPKSIGYIMERLFIVWYMRNNYSTLRYGPHPRF